jgi:hypothetical protein
MFLLCPPTNFLVDRNSVNYGLHTNIVPQEGYKGTTYQCLWTGPQGPCANKQLAPQFEAWSVCQCLPMCSADAALESWQILCWLPACLGSPYRYHSKILGFCQLISSVSYWFLSATGWCHFFHCWSWYYYVCRGFWQVVRMMYLWKKHVWKLGLGKRD